MCVCRGEGGVSKSDVQYNGCQWVLFIICSLDGNDELEIAKSTRYIGRQYKDENEAE